ncbi:MAG: hypothetical protein H0U51_00800 [Propionibacteriales bacterium]|jgi:hypothetical protein|nr:hypothetical protein [Propionibacteriales bacterium]
MVERRFSRKVAIAVVAFVTGSAGLASGFAYGLVEDPAPAGVSAEPDGTPAPRVAPDYPSNVSGLTYGSVESANSPEDEPDLILVEMQDGSTGYIKKAQLNRVTGGTVSNPTEALAWQARVETSLPSTIPVYAQDGITILGEFEIAPSN